MLHIRKASCRDGATIAGLMKDKYSFESPQEAHAAYQSECKYQHFRIAEEDGRIVGIIGWRPQGIVKHGVVELTRLAVARNVLQPKKVIEMLFDVMVAEADYFYKEHGVKLRKVFSMIHADALHIKEFYEDKGMQQEAILRNHFHNGTDELVFSLFLP